MTDAPKPSSIAPINASAPADTQRRAWLGNTVKATASLGILALADPLIRSAAWAAGSDAPEKTEVKIGFIPLTDCASVVMASVLGFDKKHGVTIVPTKEASWAGVREKLSNGDLDFAHVLYGMIYGMHLGIAGARQDMAVLMGLNQNGQGITLSNQLREAGVTDGESLHKKMAAEPRQYTFAHTFPTGTHAMWLYYWLAGHGIDPTATRSVTVPPPQMVANMRIGNVDGYCVGEPWNARAIIDKLGFSAATSQDIWPDHPEKVLGARSEFVQRHPNTARAVTAAILEAARWIDSSPQNIRKTAETIAAKSYVNTDAATIIDRMQGRYTNGLGRSWTDKHPMRFHGDGAVNFPYLSDGMWFLTQHKRWGLLKEHPDYASVAGQVNRIDIYKEAAAATGTALPSSPSRSSKLFDGVAWDAGNAAAYADGFAIKAA